MNNKRPSCKFEDDFNANNIINMLEKKCPKTAQQFKRNLQNGKKSYCWHMKHLLQKLIYSDAKIGLP